MSRNSSTNNKLSNIPDALHNFNTHDVDDECCELYKANYLFMKQSPMYVRLEQKYKNLKKKLREQSKMIDLLNKQYFETVEKYAGQNVLARNLNHIDTQTTEPIQVKIKTEPIQHIVEVVDLTNDGNLSMNNPDGVSECHTETPENPIQVGSVEEDETEEVEEEEEADVETEEVEVEVEEEVEVETEEVETEEVEVEVEEEVETEEVEVEVEEETEEVEVEVEEETEEVEEEDETEEVEVEEEETEEVEVEVEEEETEEVEVEVEEEEEEEEETEEVEVEVEEEEEEEEETEEVEVEVEEEEEEGVYETVIKGKKYYITNETNGEIYAVLEDDDIGDVVGKYVNGVPTFI